MSEEQITETVLGILGRIAPDADLGKIDPTRRYRDQFGFDSVDFLNFAMGIQAEFNVLIPEIDYPRLATLKSCVEYLVQREIRR